jgi:hypothetical protein
MGVDLFYFIRLWWRALTMKEILSQEEIQILMPECNDCTHIQLSMPLG